MIPGVERMTARNSAGYDAPVGLAADPVVFTLVELGLLMSQASDSREEFIGVFDFDQAFEREYPWCGAMSV